MGARQDFKFRTTKGGTAARVTFTGPFFESDPAATVRVNIRGLLDAMAQDGETAVKHILGPHSKSGALSGSIHGRTRSLSGKPWALTAVVSSNLNEVIAKSRGQSAGHWRGSYAGFIETGLRLNDRVKTGSAIKMSRSGNLRVVGVYQRRRVTTSFGGYHMFRSVSAALRASNKTAVADLTKGLG